MDICILHYHLNPGGVTRIIESQINAIHQTQPGARIKVICGNCPDKNFERKHKVEIVVNEIFNYLEIDISEISTKLNCILENLQKQCNYSDVLHFHNPNLGKNPLITLALYLLAEKGYSIVNHTHDFAEDRLENLNFLRFILEENLHFQLSNVMYPNFRNYHIACLTSFDLLKLKSYGIEEKRIHFLPNPVSFPIPPTDKFKCTKDSNLQRNAIVELLGLDEKKLIITYPVRAIKRKNIGEFVLLSVLFKDKANWIVTQPPMNPQELLEYIEWKKFCEAEGITIIWEAGNKVDFEKLISASDYCITTSIQEGFGMAFLEPWIFGTQVIGRDIPSATNDLKLSGVEFPLLYENFAVHDNKELHQLALSEQMSLIHNCRNKESYRLKLFESNSFLKDFFIPANHILINKNKAVILQEYSLEKYGNRLHEIYRRIIERP